MKKLLTVSLVAVMAVSAAHADIASTNYVDARTTEVSFADTNYLNAETGLEAAVKALDTQLGKVTGTAGNAVTTTDFEAFKTANTTAIGNAKSEAIAAAATDAESKVNTLANGAVKDNTDAIAAINNTTTGILATAKGYTDTELGALKGISGVQACTEDTVCSLVIKNGILRWEVVQGLE